MHLELVDAGKVLQFRIMKKILFILVMLAVSNSKAQTDTHWYGYPPDRQVSTLVGGLTGAIFYSVARSNMENEPKWKSVLISAGGTLFTSSVMALMPGQTAVERRQNFTAGMSSGIGITLVFSLGI